jgi:hypothetical protein
LTFIIFNLQLLISFCLLSGGGTRIRTGDEDFANPCLRPLGHAAVERGLYHGLALRQGNLGADSRPFRIFLRKSPKSNNSGHLVIFGLDAASGDIFGILSPEFAGNIVVEMLL